MVIKCCMIFYRSHDVELGRISSCTVWHVIGLMLSHSEANAQASVVLPHPIPSIRPWTNFLLHLKKIPPFVKDEILSCSRDPLLGLVEPFSSDPKYLEVVKKPRRRLFKLQLWSVFWWSKHKTDDDLQVLIMWGGGWKHEHYLSSIWKRARK